MENSITNQTIKNLKTQLKLTQEEFEKEYRPWRNYCESLENKFFTLLSNISVGQSLGTINRIMSYIRVQNDNDDDDYNNTYVFVDIFLGEQMSSIYNFALKVYKDKIEIIKDSKEDYENYKNHSNYTPSLFILMDYLCNYIRLNKNDIIKLLWDNNETMNKFKKYNAVLLQITKIKKKLDKYKFTNKLNCKKELSNNGNLKSKNSKSSIFH